MSQDLIEAPGGELGHLSVTKVLERVNLIQEVLSKVMKEGTHYGASFPGDTKKNLLKPGAECLGVTFQLYPDFEVEEQVFDAWHRNFKVKAIIKHQGTGAVVGMGLGSCSTLESKYRYRKLARKCPKCEKEAIIKGNEQYGGGWICWKNHKKNPGCGAKFADNDKAIIDQPEGQKENEDPADQWNTALKIAKKRALVDGMITATGCSDMFTQDAEDIAENYEANKKKDEAANPAPKPETGPKAAAPQALTPAKPKTEAEIDRERQARAGEESQEAPQAEPSDDAGSGYMKGYKEAVAAAKNRGDLNSAWSQFQQLVAGSKLEQNRKDELLHEAFEIKKSEAVKFAGGGR